MSLLLNAVQRLEHENIAKKSKQTTEGKRKEKVGEREGRGGGQGETRRRRRGGGGGGRDNLGSIQPRHQNETF